MAKSLSSRQTETVGRRARATIPLVKWTTYSDKAAGTVANTRYFSDRACIYDYGNAGTNRHFYDALVSLPDRFRATMNHLPDAQGGAAPSQRKLSLTFANAPLETTDTSLLATLRSDGLEMSTVEIAELDRKWESEPDGIDLRALTGDEHVVWGRFDVEGLERASEADLTVGLVSPEPEIPWVVLADATNNDPEDLGKRHNIIYGSVKRVRCLGVTAPARTTLAQAITATTTGDVKVTSTTGMGTVAQIGGERVSGSVTDAVTYNISARAQSGTVAADHPAGTAMVEILNGAKWAFSGHVSKAIDAVYCMNPYNGELFTLTSSTHYSTTLNDSGISTISMTDTQMKALYDAMARSAAVTTQPTVTHDVNSSQEQWPSSGDSNIIDGNLATYMTIPNSGGASSGTISFTNLGTVVDQSIWIYRGSGDWLALYRGAYGAGGTIIGSAITPSADGWYRFPVGNLNYNDFWLSNASGSVGFDLHDVYREIVYEAADPSVTNTAIAGGDIGYPLDLYADGQGYAAPDSTYYSVSSGTLLEHPSDILRHLIAVVCGKGHGAIDDTTFDATVTNLGTYKLAANIADLGVSFRDVAGRLAFESACNLVQEETSSASIWKLLSPSYDSGNDVYEFATASAVSLTQREWSSCEERGRSADEIFTRFRVLYDRDPSLGDGEDAYRGLLRCDKDQNDISTQIATSNFTTAEQRFGRRDHQGFGLRCINDATSAKWWAGYFCQELMRPARLLVVDGLPWDVGYALERGDLVYLQTPWDTASRYWRVLEHEYDFATAAVGIVALEVMT